VRAKIVRMYVLVHDLLAVLRGHIAIRVSPPAAQFHLLFLIDRRNNVLVVRFCGLSLNRDEG
jgi:hypothetical protein